MRAGAGFGTWSANPIVREVRLDAAYYVGWASDVAGGDLFGTGGTVGGEPFLLNPLYAYVLAPVVGLFGPGAAPVMVLQALLAGGTAALTAAAASR